MATQQNTQLISELAGADLSADQNLFVKMSAAKTVNVCSAITDEALGVLTNKPTQGQAASVAIDGTVKVKAGGVIPFGSKVAPMASGKAQVAASTQFPRGIALEAAAADGDLIEIALIPSGAALP